MVKAPKHSLDTIMPVLPRALYCNFSPTPSLFLLFPEITFYQFLQQLIPFQPADQVSGVAVAGDIGRITGKQVSYQLVDWIISFFDERIVDLMQYVSCLVNFLGLDLEHHGLVCKIRRHLWQPPLLKTCLYTHLRA